MEWWNVVIPILTLVLGGVLSQFGEARRDARQVAKEDRASQRARSEAIAARRESFELDTLTSTYHALNDLARASVRFHLIDLDVARKLNIPYASRQLGDFGGAEEIGETLRVATRDASNSIALILDDDLRDLALSATDSIAMVHEGPKSVDVANAEADASLMRVALAQKAIAARIREIYAASIDAAALSDAK